MLKKTVTLRILRLGAYAILLSVLLWLMPSHSEHISPPPYIPEHQPKKISKPPDVSPQPPPSPAVETAFPVPDGLQSRVDFWKKIFGRYDRNYALIYDEWYPEVIYEIVDMRQFGKRPMKKAEKIRKKYKALLQKTASARENPELLTPAARRIWDLYKNVQESLLAPIKDAHQRIRLLPGRAYCFKQGVSRSGRYLDMIKKVLKEYQLPEDLAYLPMVESIYDTNSVSYKGASGLWQLMRRTAKQYSLRMDHLIDERRDPCLATHAAARYIAHNYEVLQSWPLAVTAYNRGLQGMVTAVKTAGSKKLDTIIQTYDSKKFQFAVRNFYAEFLAAIHICGHLDAYFPDIEMAAPPDVIKFQVPDFVSVSTFEHFLGISAGRIRDLNPALQETVFTPGFYIPKGYKLNIPAVQKKFIKTGYAAIPDRLKFVQAPSSQHRHRVRKGETLSEIARLHTTTIKALMWFNGIRNPKRIRPGQHLKIPGKYMALNE